MVTIYITPQQVFRSRINWLLPNLEGYGAASDIGPVYATNVVPPAPLPATGNGTFQNSDFQTPRAGQGTAVLINNPWTRVGWKGGYPMLLNISNFPVLRDFASQDGSTLVTSTTKATNVAVDG